MNARGRSGLRRLAAWALALVLVAGGDARSYPIARERELGERFSLEAAAALPILRDPTVTQFVSRVGQRIVDRLGSPQPFDYRFTVVRDSQLNAFAVPGGFVYVNSGLLSRVANDAELAGVLGHEIAHTHAHHIVRQQEKTQLVNYAALAGILLSVIQPAIGAAAIGAAGATQLKYQRDFEQEADYLGMRFMREAGYDPHGMVSFLKRISEEQRGNPVNVPPYLLSHPLTDDRITNLEASTKNLVASLHGKKPSFDLLRVQAVVRGLSEDRHAVRSAYEKGPRAGPEDLALLGIALIAQGDPAAGARTLEEAQRRGMQGLEGDLGFARLRQGDLDGAVRDLRARVEAEPNDAVARARLGSALLQKGDLVEAREELTLALRGMPWLDEAEYDLGQSLGRSGDTGRGIFHLARALEMRGEVERALTQYEKAEKLLPQGSNEAEEARRRSERLHEIVTQRVIGR